MRVMFCLLLALASCASCAETKQYVPSAYAETVEQHAYALYGTYVAGLEAAAKVVSHPTTPTAVVDAVETSANLADPAMRTLLLAARTVSRVRAEVAEGKSTAEDLDVAFRVLSAALNDAREPLGSFLAVLSEVLK